MFVELKNLFLPKLLDTPPLELTAEVSGTKYENLLADNRRKKISERVRGAILNTDNQLLHTEQLFKMKRDENDKLSITDENGTKIGVHEELFLNKQITTEEVTYKVIATFTCTQRNIKNKPFFSFVLEEQNSGKNKKLILYQKRNKGVIRLWTAYNERIGICRSDGHDFIRDDHQIFVTNLLQDDRITFDAICDAYGFQLMESDRIKVNIMVTNTILKDKKEIVHLDDISFLSLELKINERDLELFKRNFKFDGTPEFKRISDVPIKLSRYKGTFDGKVEFECHYEPDFADDSDTD